MKHSQDPIPLWRRIASVLFAIAVPLATMSGMLALTPAVERVAADSEVVDDYETGDFSNAKSADSEAEVQSSVVLEGSYAAKNNGTNSNSEYGTRYATDQPTQVTVYFQVSSFAGSGDPFRFRLEDTSQSSKAIYVRVQNDQDIFIQDGSNTATMGANVSTDTWYGLRVDIDNSAETFDAELLDSSGSVINSYQNADFFQSATLDEIEIAGDGENSPQYWDYVTEDGKNRTKSVSGEVVDQNGDPIEDARVVVTGASNNDADIDDLTDAYEEFDTVADPIPQEWNDQVNSGFSIDSLLSTNEEVPLITPTTVDTDAVPYWTLQMEPTWRTVPDGETITVVVWDPSRTGFLQGEFDAQLPGAHVKSERTIEFEKLGTGGELLDKRQISTSERGGGAIAGGQWGAEIALTTGFWRVSLKEGGQSYYIKVGAAKAQLFDKTETDVNGTYNERAQKIRDRLSGVGTNDEGWVEKTTTTAADGSWSVDVTTDIEAVHIQAFKVTDSDIAPASWQAVQTNYSQRTTNASLYVPTEAEQVAVPSSNVTLVMREVTFPRFANASALQNLSEYRQNWLENLTLSDLPQSLQERLNDTSRTNLEDLYRDLADLREQNEELKQRIDEIAENDSGISSQEFEINVSDASDRELIERIEAMDQALTELQGGLDVQPGETDVGQDTISQEFVVDGVAVDEEGVSVVADYSNGTSNVVNDSYVAVDQSLATNLPGDSGQTSIRVEDYPINDTDPAAVQFRAKVAAEEGVGGSKSQPIENPAKPFSPPGLQYVQLSSTAPGPSERVSLDVSPETGENFDQVENVTVYGPDGTQLNTTQDGDTWRFTTNGKGVHQAEVTYSDLDGNEFTFPVRVGAQEESQNLPPSIRVRSAPAGGRYVVVSDGLESGDLSTSGGQSRVDIAAQVGEDPPGELTVWANDLSIPSQATISVQATRQNGELVRQRIGLTVHAPRFQDDALVWYHRDDDPTPFPQSDSPYGSWERKTDQTLIQTVTTEEGRLTVTQDANPSLRDSIWYRVELRLQSLPSPDLLGFLTPPLEDPGDLLGFATPTIAAPILR